MATKAIAGEFPPSQPTGFRRVYVWQLPVRFFHWLNALCVVVLCGTGLLISHPTAIAYSNEAYQQYWFGTVRFLHFATAFIFFFNFLFRIYWGFVGNEYSRWDTFIPFRKAQWQEIADVLLVDILQTRARRSAPLGRNALAGLTYFLVFLAFLFQAATGFALYSSMSRSWLPRMFAWVIPLMGGDFRVRQWHHAVMWIFILFVVVHVYLVFYHDCVEGRGTTSSMVSGWMFEREKRNK